MNLRAKAVFDHVRTEGGLLTHSLTAVSVSPMSAVT